MSRSVLPAPARALLSRPALAAGAVAVAGVLSAAGPGAATAPGPTAGERQALTLLAEAGRACYQRAYTGRQVLSVYPAQPAWARAAAVGPPEVVVVDVEHQPGQGSVLTMHSTAPAARRGSGSSSGSDSGSDSGSGRVVRESDAGTAAALPGLLDDVTGPWLQASYRATVERRAVLLGRPVTVLVLRRRAGPAAGTVAARFWVDDASKLPLRREVLDGRGRPLRTTAFTSLTLSRAAVAGPVPAPRPGAGPPVRAVAELRRSGWVVPTRLAGGLGLDAASVSGSGAGRTLHLSYTDGLWGVSVFEQVGRLEPRALAGWSRVRLAGRTVEAAPGLPQRVVWSARGRVFTVISDSGDAVGPAVRALPGPAHDGGLLARLRRGLDRVGSWLNPFG